MRPKRVDKVPLPEAVLTNYHFEPVHLADAYRIDLAREYSTDISKMAWRLFGRKESYPLYLHFRVGLIYFTFIRPFLSVPGTRDHEKGI